MFFYTIVNIIFHIDFPLLFLWFDFALGNQIDNAKDGKDIEVSLEGLNIAPSNLVQLDNDITNGEDSDDSDDDDGELVVEDVTNEQES